jgi:transposase
MVKGEEWFMIKDMYRQGLSIAEISRRTGRDRKTVRKVIGSTGPSLGRKGWSRPSKLALPRKGKTPSKAIWLPG